MNAPPYHSLNTDLIHALQNPALYNHPVQGFEIIETHISWVLLTGLYAYKIKKPLNLGFLDFSTLEKRRHYCAEELRLNRRLAPQLYLEMITITGTPQVPVFNGAGTVIEYAVKMTQFPQEMQLDRVLARGALQPEHIDQIAEVTATFHRQITIVTPETRYGNPAQVHQPVAENFAQIRPHLTTPTDIAQLERLHAWSTAEYQRHETTLQQRKDNGFIRECHGDMHLGNIALLDNKIILFDCLEFNENLRWIDVISEVAFLMMDLDSRACSPLAWRFINAYLQSSDDYAGLRVLRYYLVYRALVRAKVACIRLSQPGLDESAKPVIYQQYRTYANLAERYTQPDSAPLIITHGLSGSGKTTHTQALLESLGAVRLRSDVERKRLAGLTPDARSASGIGTGLYTATTSQHTYEHLAGLARTVIQSGYPAIIDAAFLKRAQRTLFHALAASLGTMFMILDFQAPTAVLRARITQRAQTGHDASEADLAVLDHQLASHEPLTAEELTHTSIIAADQPFPLAQIVSALRKIAKQGMERS